MARYTVGSVPYVNAIPLTWGLAQRDVDVVYDVPSRLPALLESGSADAILVSSIDALRAPGRRIVRSVGIATRSAVDSVRLFSRVPFDDIRRLALDASSMTSNRLAQIVLADTYGTRPELVTLPPSLNAMLNEADACVLIGDLGMTADGEGLNVLDLGAAWRELTGRPFLWAGWIGGERLDAELAARLDTFTLSPEVFAEAASRPGWTSTLAKDYLSRTMTYRLDAEIHSGLEEYQRRLLKLGLDDCQHEPVWV